MQQIQEIESTFNRDQTGTFQWWLGTWFNFPEDWFAKLKAAAPSGRAQLEKCPTTGRDHVQFVLHFDTRVSHAVPHVYLPGTWLEGAPGRDKNKILNYVKKTETAYADTRVEWGQVNGYWKSEGNSNRKYEEALTLCKVNKWKEIDPELQVKFLSNLFKLQAAYVEPFEAQTCRGIWVYGLPGAGKSHYARGLDPSPYIKAQNKWFDGYYGERTIVLDDFDSPALGHLLKIWADKWKCTGEIKGGTVALRHERFVITSNYLPNSTELWANNPTLVSAISRRFIFIKMEEQKISFQGGLGELPPGDGHNPGLRDRLEILPGYLL